MNSGRRWAAGGAGPPRLALFLLLAAAATGCRAQCEDSLSGFAPPAAVAEGLGIEADRLEVLARATEAAPGRERSAQLYKVYERGSGRAWRVKLVPRLSIARTDSDLCREARRRGFSPGLREWVLIRHLLPEDRPLPRESLVGKSRSEVSKLVLKRAREIEAIVEERFGPPPPGGEAFGPFVVNQAPPDTIARLCDDPETFIGRYRIPDVQDGGGTPGLSEPSSPAIEASLPTTRTAQVQGAGVLGKGIRVAVVEYGDLVYDESCFPVVGVYDTDPDAGADDHLTKSLAMVGSSLSRLTRDGYCGPGVAQGYGPGAALLMANAEKPTPGPDPRTTNDWVNGTRWAIEQRAEVLSMSFHELGEGEDGSLGSRDVFFDYWVTRYPMLVVSSAGNGGNQNRYAAAKGYNFLGVADVVNDADANRCTTWINPQSSWVNPRTLHRDRELPELAMPGSSYDIPGFPGMPAGGTSAATPAAAGVAALLLERRPQLRFWPEATRALLLATADRQLTDGMLWDPREGVDGRDGVGLVNAWQAYEAAGHFRPGSATPHGHDHGRLTGAGFEPPRRGFAPPVEFDVDVEITRRFEKSWEVQAEAGDRVRAVFTWNSDVDSPLGPSVLTSDLDLAVLDEHGCFVASSNTFDNNYELVDFAAPHSGAYRLVVFGSSLPDDFETHFGVAWMAAADPCGVGS